MSQDCPLLCVILQTLSHNHPLVIAQKEKQTKIKKQNITHTVFPPHRIHTQSFHPGLYYEGLALFSTFQHDLRKKPTNADLIQWHGSLDRVEREGVKGCVSTFQRRDLTAASFNGHMMFDFRLPITFHLCPVESSVTAILSKQSQLPILLTVTWGTT